MDLVLATPIRMTYKRESDIQDNSRNETECFGVHADLNKKPVQGHHNAPN